MTAEETVRFINRVKEIRVVSTSDVDGPSLLIELSLKPNNWTWADFVKVVKELRPDIEWSKVPRINNGEGTSRTEREAE